MAMDTDRNNTIKTVVDALKANRFHPVRFVETAEEAKRAVQDLIPPDAVFVLAGSTTIGQLGFTERMMRGFSGDAEPVHGKAYPLRQPGNPTPDILVTSSNAVTLDGKLVNTDGAGNRVAGMIFGPKKVILVIGMNKIVRNVEEAMGRIRNVIAPYHARELGCKTPCATTLRCSDCNSPDRICNVTTILEKKPSRTDISILLVGEDLGLGWDPEWNEARREKILSVYRHELQKMRRARGA
jgi:hypothetical protein